MCRVKVLETLNPKRDVSIKSLPSDIRELRRREVGNTVSVRGDA